MNRDERHLTLLQVKESKNLEPLALLHNGKWQDVEEIIGRWRLNLEWWKRPVERDYFRLRLPGGIICEVFRDIVSGCWQLFRVYD